MNVIFFEDAACRTDEGKKKFTPKRDDIPVNERADLNAAAKRMCLGDPESGREPCPALTRCQQHLPTYTGPLVFAGTTADERRKARRHRSSGRSVQSVLQEGVRRAATESNSGGRLVSTETRPQPHPALAKPRDETIDYRPPRRSRLEELMIYVGAAKVVDDQIVFDPPARNPVVPADDDLAVAIGYANWNQARNFIDNLVKEGCAQLRLTGFGRHLLEVDCQAIASRLSRMQRSLEIHGSQQGRRVMTMTVAPEKRYRAPRKSTSAPAPHPDAITDITPFLYLVHDDPDYVHSSPPGEPCALRVEWIRVLLGPVAEAGGILVGRSQAEICKAIAAELGKRAEGRAMVGRNSQFLDSEHYVQRGKGGKSIMRLTEKGVWLLCTYCPDIMRPLARQSALTHVSRSGCALCNVARSRSISVIIDCSGGS